MKNMFEAQIVSFENVVQISPQDILQTAFSKMIGSPLTSAHRLKDRSPNLTVMQPRLLHIYNKVWMTYLECIYTVQVSFSLKIHHLLDMSQISVECLNHYCVVYGLNLRKLKDSVVGHWSVHWKSIEDCFRDICTFGVGYKRAKGYCRAEFDTPET